MPIVIKEIRVSTVVEKRVVLSEEISPGTMELLKKAVLEELQELKAREPADDRRKRER